MSLDRGRAKPNCSAARTSGRCSPAGIADNDRFGGAGRAGRRSPPPPHSRAPVRRGRVRRVRSPLPCRAQWPRRSRDRRRASGRWCCARRRTRRQSARSAEALGVLLAGALRIGWPCRCGGRVSVMRLGLGAWAGWFESNADGVKRDEIWDTACLVSLSVLTLEQYLTFLSLIFNMIRSKSR